MLKLIGCLTLAASVVAISSAGAAFVIKLKNGNEFVTGRYWHEGRQVLFDTYGGVFGVDKAFVIKIEHADKPVKTLSSGVESPGASRTPDPGKESTGSKKLSDPSEAPDKVKRDDDPIMKDFYVLKEKFAVLDSMLTSEIIEFSKQVSDFKRKVQTSRKSNDYLNEFSEAFKMGHTLEETLKSRGQ